MFIGSLEEICDFAIALYKWFLVACNACNYADLLLSVVMASKYEDDGVSLFATYVSYVCCFVVFLGIILYNSYILGQGDCNCTWGSRVYER